MEVTNISPAGAISIPAESVKNIGKRIESNSSDSGAVSELSRVLSENKIDISKSLVSAESGSLHFNLKFLNQSVEKTTLNGYFAEDLSSGELSFRYNFTRSINENGKNTVHNYEANFEITFKNLSSLSITKSEKKEDILDFLRRITTEIFKKLNDEKTNITAIVLNPEDLKEIAQLTDKKVITLIYRLIELIKWAVEAKKMANRGKGTKDIIYQPQREKTEITETEKKVSTSINYSYSIKETGVTEPAN